ncbi:hypothetical protein [Paenibacillus wynnii]|uniref:hypothetical protein n=1 Tax=Paenibacillus wynnii TaxID=268407 RepID=UPI002792A388|nr:hypothetical protein [Paenibacillus wynnii]MDQ0192754.1 outer membrane murein-binding lipoprotein Lpp [Paenibacillus wynnii]
MRQNYKPILAAVVLSMVLLAGCTQLPGKADNNWELIGENEVRQDLGTALQQDLGEAAAGLEQTVEDSAIKLSEHIITKGISKKLSAAKEVGSSTVLSINNPVGTIEVKPASGNQIIVNTTIWFDNNSNHEADRQEIMDNAEVSIQLNGDKITASTHVKNNPKKDLWTWAQDKFDYSNFSIDYSIEVPESVDMYQITNNVGEVQLHDLQGTYRIVSNVGAVKISGAAFTGKSTVESNTGSIHLDIADMKAKSSLKVKTDIGSISASLAKSLQCSLEIESELGVINGAEDGKSEINGGGPLISLSSSIGAITIDN